MSSEDGLPWVPCIWSVPQAPTFHVMTGSSRRGPLPGPKTLPLSTVKDRRQQLVPKERLLGEAEYLKCLQSHTFQIKTSYLDKE